MPTLNTPYGTLSFPHFFQPKPRAEGGEPVYSGVIIFDEAAQQSAAYKGMQQACIKAAKDEWGEKVQLKNVRMPFRDAGEKAGKYAGYVEGHMFISPWTKSKPGIVDARRQDILLPEEIWAGQLIRMNLTPFAWLNSGKYGVSFALNHVQIIRTDTPRIDGRAAAGDAFADEVDTEADSGEDNIF